MKKHEAIVHAIKTYEELIKYKTFGGKDYITVEYMELLDTLDTLRTIMWDYKTVRVGKTVLQKGENI